MKFDPNLVEGVTAETAIANAISAAEKIAEYIKKEDAGFAELEEWFRGFIKYLDEKKAALAAGGDEEEIIRVAEVANEVLISFEKIAREYALAIETGILECETGKDYGHSVH